MGTGNRPEDGVRMINLSSRKLHTANGGALRKDMLRGSWRLAALAAPAAATLAACSSFGGLTGNGAPPAPASTASATPAPTSSNPSFASRVKSFFSGDSTNLNSPAPQPAGGAAAADI